MTPPAWLSLLTTLYVPLQSADAFLKHADALDEHFIDAKFSPDGDVRPLSTCDWLQAANNKTDKIDIFFIYSSVIVASGIERLPRFPPI